MGVERVEVVHGDLPNGPDNPMYVSQGADGVVPGTGPTDLGKAEDGTHASGDTGVMALAVRQDTLVALAANGDYIPLTVDALGRLQVATAADGVASAEFTRANNATAYTAKDVVGPAVTALLEFAALSRPAAGGGAGYITGARLMTTDTGVSTVKTRLHLYREAPTPIADNAAFTLLYANRLKRVGFIDFPALSTEAAGSDAYGALLVPGQLTPSTMGQLPLKYNCAAADTKLYGILETLDAIGTPLAQSTWTVVLTADLF